MEGTGGDSAEYALDAINLTLQATDEYGVQVMEPGSQIIVLTDAPSKNTDIEKLVIEKANDLRVCIHFFLAPDTGDQLNITAIEMYERIASETNGTVVHNAWEFSNFVASYRKSPCTALEMSRVKRSTSMDHNHSFRVSRFTSHLKLSVRPQKEQLTVKVRNPSGNATTLQVINPSSENRFAVFSELHPESGEWSVESDEAEVYHSLTTILDVVMLYPKYKSRLSDVVSVTSSTPPACKFLKNA